MRLPGSLAGRLVAVAALWSLVTMAATGVGLSALFSNEVRAGFDRELAASVDALAATVNITQDGALVVPRPLPDPRFSRPLSGRYWAVGDVTPEGVMLPGAARSRSLFDETLTAPQELALAALAKPGETQGAEVLRAGERLRLAARTVTLPDHERPILLLVAADLTETVRAAQRFTLILSAALAALGVGLVAAIFLQVRLGLAPVRSMGEQLAAIRAGRRERLDSEAPRELAPLAHELNALIDHNQAVVERARTHVGNLAHALKTPISVLRNEAATRKDGFAGLVGRQADTMARQVEHYLKRAAAAARAEAIGLRADVAPVVDDVLRTLQRLYRPDGVKLTAGPVPDGLAFRGEREDLEDLFGNLAENAAKYGGGLVEVTVEQPAPGRMVLIIDDDGEGLSDAQAITALKRGVRLDETAPGTGLGLSICDELARAYGGSLNLERSPLGGLRARLELPAADT
jgi:signal transduction histidine kinase